MKKKIITLTIIALSLLIYILVYKLPVISLWRSYNNGVRAFNERNYLHAATEFDKASKKSQDPILKYNQAIALWSDIMKKTKDLKINSVNDTTLTADIRQELMTKIKNTHKLLNQLISNNNVGKKLKAKIFYAKGILFLFEDYKEEALQAFKKSSATDKSFIAPLVEEVKYSSTSDRNPLADIVINMAEIKPIKVVTGWKPF